MTKQYDSCAQPTFDFELKPEPKRVNKMIQIKEHAEALKTILDKVGTRGECRGCHASIYWVHEDNKTVPFNLDGTNHFTTCPDRESFRKP